MQLQPERGRTVRRMRVEGASPHGGRSSTRGVDTVRYHGALRIVLPTRGTAIRSVITGTKVIGSASYISRRSRASYGVEAETEWCLALHDEVVVDVVRAKAQPMRIELTTSASKLVHIPDKARQMADGRWQIIDAKREWKDFRTADGERQTMLGQMAADVLGHEYVRIVRDHFNPEEYKDRLELIQLYRFVNVTERQKHVAASMLEERGEVALGELADALDHDAPKGFAFVCSLMVQRIADIDLSRAVNRHSRVRGVPLLPATMPGLVPFAPAVPTAA